MNSNPKSEGSRGREANKQRRRLLKLAALGGAADRVALDVSINPFSATPRKNRHG